MCGLCTIQGLYMHGPSFIIDHSAKRMLRFAQCPQKRAGIAHDAP